MCGISKMTECDLSKRAILQFGEAVSSDCNYNIHDNMENIIELFNGRIYHVNPNKFLDESLEILVGCEDKNAPSFIINSSNDYNKDYYKFRLAHEFGHFILHHTIIENTTYKRFPRYGTGLEEWQAHWFAYGFLLPENQLKESLFRNNNCLTDVARECTLPISIVENRLKELNLQYF